MSITSVSISWSQALAWRLGRHLLDPVGSTSAAEVVQRLGAVLATDAGSAELAVGIRRTGSRIGDLERAVAAGDVVTSFAFRGAVHHLSAADGGAYLALRCAGRQWELPSWQEHYRLGPGDWPGFRAAVRDALADGPLTVRELGAAVTRRAAYRHLRPVFEEGAGTLVKPLCWQGDISFGPPREGRATFQRLDDNPHWAGVWELDEAGPYAILAYVGAYGPATPDHLQHWLGDGLSAGRKRLSGWLAGLGDRLETVDVEGESAYVLAEHVEGLRAVRPTTAVRLLPGHDQWIMGPGSKDEHLVATPRREPITRKANPVIRGGVVVGTWRVRGDDLALTWFGEHGTPPRPALEEQAAVLCGLLDRPLRPLIETA